MRLLRREVNGDFSLKEYVGNDLPKYAILSHAWGTDNEEVTMRDLVEGTAKGKAGYRKLTFCVEQAAKDGLQFCWVDTCSIDKSSSAELSEAINSMFRWYQRATKCYVYLSDVWTNVPAGRVPAPQRTWKPDFQKSRWFTRGWTLQELLAPKSLEFFSAEGERLGDRNSLIREVHNITKISLSALRGEPLSQFSVRTRLLWADKRETKREEDAAYSLLGIFDIHMPLIYGEGRESAFLRLRKEINEKMEAGGSDLQMLQRSKDISSLVFHTDSALEMVLDPLSALSVAGNVVEFVQFSGLLVSRVIELCRTTTKIQAPPKELVTLAQNLKRDADKLIDSLDSELGDVPGQNMLKILVNSCSDLADRLLAVLDSFKAKLEESTLEVHPETERSVVRALVVKELVEQMGKLRDALHSHLLDTLKDLVEQQRAVNAKERLASLEDIVASIKTFQRDLERKDEEALEPPRKKSRHTQEVACVNEQQERSRAEQLLALPENMQTWTSILLESAQQAKINRTQHRILLSLKFPDMRLRESNINEAHKYTCDWVLETDQDRDIKAIHDLPLINTWLRSGYGVFWVAGKAGSGKSTLMKHVVRQASKIEKLVHRRTWSQEVVIGSYFFWNSGSKLQKSQEGLLRTIFYQIFRSCPHLIPVLCPEKWQEATASGDHVSDWTLRELLDLLRHFFSLKLNSTIFYLFIDGLDEFDGDPLDLVHTLCNLDDNPDIRMCLSSRPWNYFEEAFGKDETKLIRLEEHNRKDIIRFIRDTISSSPGYPYLQRQGTECDALIDEIVEKANGVFLWVFLVTRSLMRGLVNGDFIHDLRVRLRQFPPELEPYFMHMFKSIEQVYLQETAELLQIAVTATEPHPLLLYQALLARDIDSFGETLKWMFENSDLEAFLEDLDRTKKRINARCQDLVETTKSPPSLSAGSNPFMEAYHGSKVEFLHRTVSDFLRGPEMTALLSKHVGEGFDPRSRINKGFQLIFNSFEYLNRDDY